MDAKSHCDSLGLTKDEVDVCHWVYLFIYLFFTEFSFIFLVFHLLMISHNLFPPVKLGRRFQIFSARTANINNTNALFVGNWGPLIHLQVLRYELCFSGVWGGIGGI